MESIYKFMACFVLMFLMEGIMNAQITVAKWDFNSTTGTLTPVMGSGTALPVETTTTFKTGDGSTDLVTAATNFGWQTSSYAGSGKQNKECGVQFNVNTVGYH